MVKQQDFDVPKNLQEHYNEIVKITYPFCQTYLNDEYLQLCHKMAAALARKRTSPLFSGYINIWAAAILYTLGSINFLYDKSTQPYMQLQDLCDKLGLSKSTVSQKSAVIKRLLKISQFDTKWALSSIIENMPQFWMIEVENDSVDLFVDAREMPREIQEMAFVKGLIPYIPKEKKK